MAYDLAAAWDVCNRETARQYPNKLEWRDKGHPAHWLHATQGSIASLTHMPTRAQKALSKAFNKRIAKGSRARIRRDQSIGAARRLVRAVETTVQHAGYAISAHPWQSSQTLSIASHEVLLAMYTTARLRLAEIIHRHKELLPQHLRSAKFIVAWRAARSVGRSLVPFTFSPHEPDWPLASLLSAGDT
eukprot:COSAG02_NODE_17831_length_977_cov_1.807517_2_plen_188_part_00